MGASVDKSNEWAIVGGTGNFAMANGVIKRTEYKVTGDEKIHELTIDGYCYMPVSNLPSCLAFNYTRLIAYGQSVQHTYVC
jgi:hypothetical protein